ncbi:zf-TFIIB domain-containing protein [Antribacter gilvus]|uniref:TFIIB-type zinc ribbon-containing protein n=1 Tax=Antribacter gilvus TaxID=2304675 RepID=UPI000F779947|nr:zf-TFIIB domain-containing protein [Antribacter gilvus]
MLCPVDQATLVITERKGVEIDYCPQCRGVWLDRGELDKVIDRVEAESGGAARGVPDYGSPAPAAPPVPQQPPAPGYAQPGYPPQPQGYPQPGYDQRRDDRSRDERYRDDRYRDERGYGHKKKKKESFLEDLFDF